MYLLATMHMRLIFYVMDPSILQRIDKITKSLD